MIDWIKQAVFYGIIIALIWLTAVYLPRFQHVAVSEEYYSEIRGIDTVKDYALDATVTLTTLNHGDGICYQLADRGDLERCLGWVAGLPGDIVSTDAQGKVMVNGTALAHGNTFAGPPYGPLVVPAGHFMVVTDGHHHDSLKHGPLSVTALRGRVGELP